MQKESLEEGNHHLGESLKSEGEVFPLRLIQDIENHLKKGDNDKRKAKKEKSYVDVELFKTYLEQLQNACNHNLAVAQTYAVYLRQNEEAIAGLTQKLEEKEQTISELSAKINDNIKKSSLELTDIKFERERFSTLYLNYQKENEVLKTVLREKEKLMKEKDDMNDLLEKTIALRMNEINDLKLEYSEQIDRLVKSLAMNEKEKEELNQRATGFKLQLIEKQNEASRLDDKILLEEKNYEKFYSTMKSQYTQKDADFRQERAKNERLCTEVEALKLELAKLENLLQKETETCRELKFREENLSRKCMGLENRMTEMVKEEVDRSTERFRDKIVATEVKMQRREEELAKIETESVRMKGEISNLNSEIAFLRERGENLEADNRCLVDEKARFLDNVRSLQEKYSELIDKAEQEKLALQKNAWNFQCENESLKIRLQKLEENEELVRNFMKFKNDATFLNLVHRLKDQDLVKISSSELARIKAMADQDFQLYKNNIQDLRIIEENEAKINKELRHYEPINSKEEDGKKWSANQDGFFDREWEELMASINTFKLGPDDYKLKGASDRLSRKGGN